jgi:hypothetical protein
VAHLLQQQHRSGLPAAAARLAVQAVPLPSCCSLLLLRHSAPRCHLRLQQQQQYLRAAPPPLLLLLTTRPAARHHQKRQGHLCCFVVRVHAWLYE